MIFFLTLILTEYVSIYDSKLQNAPEIHGFLAEHTKVVDVKGLGNFSILSYNFESKKFLEARQQTEDLGKLIDNAHIPVLCLQEISKDQIISLKGHILPHYEFVGEMESLIVDPVTGAETYNTIVYDTESLKELKHGVFKPNDSSLKSSYGMWAKFLYKPMSLEFIVININLFSSKALVDSLELSSILYDVQNTPEVKNNLVLVAGTINGVSDTTKTLLQKGVIKLSNYNKDPYEQINTLNSYIDLVSNTERDFIFALKNPKVSVQPVYGGRLDKFSSGARIPIHSIFNITPH